LCDLDEAERAELVEYFAEKLDISNEKVEHIIECAFDWILDGIEFFEAFSYEPEEVV
jgi:nucleoid DNA-binding protein